MKKSWLFWQRVVCVALTGGILLLPLSNSEAAKKHRSVKNSGSVISQKGNLQDFIKTPSVPAKNSSSQDKIGRYDSNPTILGAPVATEEQCVKYLLKVNPHPKINGKAQELVRSYYQEGEKNGVRPDIAFAQALHETGFFRYGGSVKASQNNFCGLGSVNARAGGAKFDDLETGVKAHIQHIMAYSTTRHPHGKIVDPRYDVVMRTNNFGTARYWTDLNGKWAVPGHGYGEKILAIYNNILIN